MTFEITCIGDPSLRQVTTELPESEISSERIQSFIDELVATMKLANGSGLAAPQVSSSYRIFAAYVDNNVRYPYKPAFPLTIAINPRIAYLTDETYVSNEGCLSIPGIRCEVKRCPLIRLDAFDRSGSEFSIRIGGVAAGTMQHELDHLNGVLIVDRMIDSRTISTWNNFAKYCETDYIQNVQELEASYGEWTILRSTSPE